MIESIPQRKYPISIPLLKSVSKILVLDGVTIYKSKSHEYSHLDGKPGFKVTLPTKKTSFLFADIIEALANKLNANKITIHNIGPLEEAFSKLLQDVIKKGDQYLYPSMNTLETYYLATALWWISFSAANVKQIDPELLKPTSDPVELNRRVSMLLKTIGIEKPVGQTNPSKKSSSTEQFERDPQVKAWILKTAGNSCEVCRQPAPFITDDNRPYLEVHHVKMLSSGGSDTITNTIALCPNCHMYLHHAQERQSKTEQLYNSISRLKRE